MSGEGVSALMAGLDPFSCLFCNTHLASLKPRVGGGGVRIPEVPGTEAYPFSQPRAHPATTAPPPLSTGSFPKTAGPGGYVQGPDTGELDGPLLPEPGPSAGGCLQDPREGAHAFL